MALIDEQHAANELLVRLYPLGNDVLNGILQNFQDRLVTIENAKATVVNETPAFPFHSGQATAPIIPASGTQQHEVQTITPSDVGQFPPLA